MIKYSYAYIFITVLWGQSSNSSIILPIIPIAVAADGAINKVN